MSLSANFSRVHQSEWAPTKVAFFPKQNAWSIPDYGVVHMPVVAKYFFLLFSGNELDRWAKSGPLRLSVISILDGSRTSACLLPPATKTWASPDHKPSQSPTKSMRPGIWSCFRTWLEIQKILHFHWKMKHFYEQSLELENTLLKKPSSRRALESHFLRILIAKTSTFHCHMDLVGDWLGLW